MDYQDYFGKKNVYEISNYKFNKIISDYYHCAETNLFVHKIISACNNFYIKNVYVYEIYDIRKFTIEEEDVIKRFKNNINEILPIHLDLAELLIQDMVNEGLLDIGVYIVRAYGYHPPHGYNVIYY